MTQTTEAQAASLESAAAERRAQIGFDVDELIAEEKGKLEEREYLRARKLPSQIFLSNKRLSY
jgi:hypothetical protein